MKYAEICVFTTTSASEAVAEILADVTGEAVSLRDKNDLAAGGWDYVEEGLYESYSDEAEVRGFFDPSREKEICSAVKQRLALLKECFFDCGSLDTKISFGDDGDWLVNWQKNFRPIDFGPLVVCPEWIECAADKPVLRLNSGISFGTGTHETTAMCLKLLTFENLKDRTVIDVGCGSGILGLSALLLGARRATLVDIDPQAVEAAKANAALNDLTDRCVFAEGNLCDDVSERGIVLANLTADILARLAPDISRVASADDFVVLSGILKDRLDETISLFTERGFDLSKTTTEGEWSAAVLKIRPTWTK